RGYGNHVAAGTEMGSDFNDADLWNFGETTAGTGAASAAARATAESRAPHGNAARQRRGRAVRRRWRRRRGHRDVILLFCIWRTRRRRRLLGLRGFVPPNPANRLLQPVKRTSERESGRGRFRGWGGRGFRLLRLGRFGWFVAASSAPPSPTAAPAPVANDCRLACLAARC